MEKMINGEMLKLTILWTNLLLFSLVLGGCINNNSNTNISNDEVYKVLLLTDTVCNNYGYKKVCCKIQVECKDKWVNYFSSEVLNSRLCSKTIISYLLDTSDNAIFINGYEKTILKVDLNNGELLVQKDISRYDLYVGSRAYPPKFYLVADKVVFTCGGELLILSKDLEVEYAYSDEIEKRLSQYEHSKEYTYIEYPQVKMSNDSLFLIIKSTFKYALGLGTETSPFQIKSYTYKDTILLSCTAAPMPHPAATKRKPNKVHPQIAIGVSALIKPGNHITKRCDFLLL